MKDNSSSAPRLSSTYYLTGRGSSGGSCHYNIGVTFVCHYSLFNNIELTAVII